MSNDINGAMKIIGWAGGVVALLITIYTQFHMPLANAITKEVECRTTGDVSLREDLSRAVIKQQTVNQEILLTLKEIQVDMRYIRVDNKTREMAER